MATTSFIKNEAGHYKCIYMYADLSVLMQYQLF